MSIGLAATATVILLALLGFLATTLPARCVSGPAAAGACLARVVDAGDPAAVRSVSGARPAPVAAGTPVVAPVEKQTSVMPAAPGLIAATFQQLQAAGSSDVTPGGEAAVTPAATGVAPSTRRVATTVIRADTAPEAATQVADASATPADLSAYAAIPAVPIVEATPITQVTAATEASAEAQAAPLPVPLQRPDVRPVASTSAVASKTQTMQVGGTGVTVRAGPSTSRSRLFALAAGQKVTVAGISKGWVQIVDAKGRRGWAYSSFLSKP